MNRLFWIPALIVLAAGGAAGAWWAFDEGHVGTNPRAPTIENFKPVIDAWAFRKGELRPKCISAAPDSAPGSRRGRSGWMGSDTMGLGVTTLTLRTSVPSQQLTRDKTLLRFDALAREGYFKINETALELDTGESLPAREYVLTRKGWENSYSNCFYAGRPEVLELVSFARVQPDPDGIRAYEIAYKTGVRALPPWADSEEAREIFGDLKPHKAVEEGRVRLLRTDKGWLPEPLVKNKDGSLDRSRLTRTLDDLLPPITPEQIMALGREHDFLRAPRACVLLPSQRGHDADEIEWSLNGPVSFTMYEADAAANPVPRVRESWSARMINLTRAGVFREESLPRDNPRNRPAGIKYTLDENFLPHIGRSGPGCLRLAPLKVDPLPNAIEPQSRQDGTPQYNFKAIGEVADDAWARSVPWSGVPEVEAYLEYGVPISGWRRHRAGDGACPCRVPGAIVRRRKVGGDDPGRCRRQRTSRHAGAFIVRGGALANPIRPRRGDRESCGHGVLPGESVRRAARPGAARQRLFAGLRRGQRRTTTLQPAIDRGNRGATGRQAAGFR